MRARAQGGIDYVCCPFNGWFAQFEIARNLVWWCFFTAGAMFLVVLQAERYKVLPAVAGLFKLDTRDPSWQDRAFLELNRAVLHSFRTARISMVDHVGTQQQFQTHVERETKCGREVPAQWSWVVPAIGGSMNSLWHCEMRDFLLYPQYRYCAERYLFSAESGTSAAQCFDAAQVAGANNEQRSPKDVLILYGSETGACERYAVQMARALVCCAQPRVATLNEGPALLRANVPEVLLVLTSTFAEGSCPSNASRFLDAALPSLDGCSTAVFGAGSSVYPLFCNFAKNVIAHLERAGGAMLMAPVFGDELDRQASAFESFKRGVLSCLAPRLKLDEAAASVRLERSDAPFAWPPALLEGCQQLRVVDNCELLKAGAGRSTRLVRFDLTNSNLTYQTGDHVKLWPVNSSATVEQLLGLVGVAPAERDVPVTFVDTATGQALRTVFPQPCTPRVILQYYLDITLRVETFDVLFPALIACSTDPIVRQVMVKSYREVSESEVHSFSFSC
jgi:sulfite reductase alpha subunit-like flavoprotein